MSSVTETMFIEKSQVVYVDQDYSVRPPPYGTIDKLMKSLQENGPLVAEGEMGPGAYTEAPFKLRDKVGSEDVYGWKPNTSKEYALSTKVILWSAKKTESKAYVYFTLATDITSDNESLIRGFKCSDADPKLYVMSYENFLNRCLVDLYASCPHAQRLFSVPVESILDRGETEEECKQIGQKIFDHYKTAAKGDSQAGKCALKRICEAAKVLTSDGLVRKAHIERAWDGVGDRTLQWFS